MGRKKEASQLMGRGNVAQSTYCHEIQEHCATLGRTVHVVNLVRCHPTATVRPHAQRTISR
jgi:hypothetical protein